MYRLVRIVPAGVATAVVTALILYLTLASNPLGGMSPRIPGFDKVAHFLMFFTFSSATVFDIAKHYYPRKLPAMLPLMAALVAILFGGAIELAQEALDTGRAKELADFIADLLGAISAPVAWHYIFSKITYKALKQQ